MSKDSKQNFRDLDVAGLEKELLELSEEQFKMRMQKGTGQLARSHRIKEVRKDIARVKTIINEKKASA
tara:strand:- start:47973 stop:48176 length:204 start_codon:yes stop_codon:yes gene_type:complete